MRNCYNFVHIAILLFMLFLPSLIVAQADEKKQDNVDNKTETTKNEIKKEKCVLHPDLCKVLGKNSPFHIKVWVLSKWRQDLTEDSLDRNGEDKSDNDNAFSLDRVFVDFHYQLLKHFKLRVTTDVANYGTNHLFMKFAYGEYSRTLGFLKLAFSFGKIKNPLVPFLNVYTDYRWIYSNYVDKSGDLLHGTDIGDTSDAGVKLTVTFFKRATLETALVNGEGADNGNEQDNAKESTGYDGKAVENLLHIETIKRLYVGGFYRYEVHARGEKEYYWGGMLLYRSKLIHTGITYAHWTQSDGFTKVDGSKEGQRKSLYDMWLQVNFDSVIKVPVIIAGRYARGFDFKVRDNDTVVYSGGLGYRFNTYTRAICEYKETRSKSFRDSEDNEINLQEFSVKSEVRF